MTLVKPSLKTNIETAVSEAFTLADDGFWYPDREGTPLVRIEVTGCEYRIFRRRYPDAEWMRLVEAQLVDFNAGAFREWINRWPMTAS